MRSIPISPAPLRIIAIAVSLSFVLTGCAFMNREKRPLLNAMDRSFQPKDPLAMVMLTPIMVPVGFTAGAIDTVLLYPATRVPGCAADIHQRYFHKPEEPLWKKSALFIPRHLVAIPDFIGLWTIRSFIDLHPYGPITAERALPSEGVVLPSQSEGLEIRVLPGGTPPGQQPRPPAERKP